MIRRLLLAMVMVLLTSLVSHAGMLACGPIFGGGSQLYAKVRVFNAGTTPVTFLSKQILMYPNVVVPLTQDSCPGNVLDPGAQCDFMANIQYNHQHAARITVDGSAEAVCAVLEILPANSPPLISTPLRPIR